jgi:hypothetical protein
VPPDEPRLLPRNRFLRHRSDPSSLGLDQGFAVVGERQRLGTDPCEKATKSIFVPLQVGHATGGYEDFITGLSLPMEKYGDGQLESLWPLMVRCW